MIALRAAHTILNGSQEVGQETGNKQRANKKIARANSERGPRKQQGRIMRVGRITDISINLFFGVKKALLAHEQFADQQRLQ